MIKSNARLKGKITVKVFGPDSKIKRFKPNFIQRLLGLPGNPMIVESHNIVTDEGDALVADLLSMSPARTKVDNTNGRIVVGTGWTGNNIKQNTWVNNQVGSPEAMDSTYPKVKSNWGGSDDNVVVYRSTFEAGKLNNNGINEAALVNGTSDGSADCLAYAQISPSVNVSSSDVLEVTWELTITGS